MKCPLHRFIMFGLMLTAWGCQGSTPLPPLPPLQSVSSTCQNQPQTSLKQDALSQIKIQTRSSTVSAAAKASVQNHIGFAFEAEVGQRIQFTVNTDNACLWLYEPPNMKIFEAAELVADKTYVLQVKEAGTHLLQVSSRQGAEDITLTTQLLLFAKSNFPKNVCGDPLPSDPSKYPIDFYPVNIPDSAKNLNKAKTSYCRDALRKISKDTKQPRIQIASFISEERAEAFADFIRVDFSDVAVGSSTVISEPR